MAREKREVWIKRVERWRESGLTAREFAAEVGIDPMALSRWSRRLRAEQRRAAESVTSPTAVLPQWVEVTAPATEPAPAPAAPASFELVLTSGVTVRVPPGFSSEALKRLLETVR
jgi:transposase-like protein